MKLNVFDRVFDGNISDESPNNFESSLWYKSILGVWFVGVVTLLLCVL